jgi:signal transduction histidine kinase
MQAMGSNAVSERRRVEAVVETLAAIHNHGESLVELAHDARNMVTALSLYCDLLEEPGVLPEAHRHYGSELRLVAEASRSLVEKLALLDEREEPSRRQSPDSPFQGQSFRDAPATERRDAATGPEPIPHWPIDDLLIHDFQDEVLASRNVLAAIAGPSIAVTVEADGGGTAGWDDERRPDPGPREPGQKRRRRDGRSGNHPPGCDRAEGWFGRGVHRGSGRRGHRPRHSRGVLDRIFEPGCTTCAAAPSGAGWASGGRRGLGLAISRGIVEAPGGAIRAGNRAGDGARFVIELPVRAS